MFFLAETFLFLLLLVLFLAGTALLIHGFIELSRDFGLFQRPRHSHQENSEGLRSIQHGRHHTEAIDKSHASPYTRGLL